MESEFASAKDVNNIGAKVNSIEVEAARLRAGMEAKMSSIEKDILKAEEEQKNIYRLIETMEQNLAIVKSTMDKLTGRIAGIVGTIAAATTLVNLGLAIWKH